jgi:proline iminopeptidase
MKKLIILFFFIDAISTLKAQVSDSIKLSNATLYYETTGNGSPILLLSGGPGVSPGQLSALRDSLSQQYKCILFDQRGTGKSHTSPFDSTTINLEQSLQDITTLLNRLNIKKVTIVGHSWGAMLALSYSIKYPDRINKLVLIGSGPLAIDDFEVVQDNIYARTSKAEKEYMSQLEDSMKASNAIAYRRSWSKLFLRSISYDATRIDTIFEEVSKSKLNPKMQSLMYQDLEKINYNLKTKIRSINSPTLTICGRQDPVGLFPSIQLKELNDKFKLVWVEKSGHFPWLENHESFYKELFAFLH